MRRLAPEQAHGWGEATRKKRGLGAIADPAQKSAKPQRQLRATTRRPRAAAAPPRGRTSLAKRKASIAARKVSGARRARTSRPSGKAGGRRAVRRGRVRRR